MVVGGSICGHLLGAGLFALQAWFCWLNGKCVQTEFDPNIYRALLHGASNARHIPDVAIEFWLLAIFSIGAATGVTAHWLSRRPFVTEWLDPISFGWLTPAVQAVKKGKSFVVAYVLTKTSNDGAFIAYEGVVQQLTLDENQQIRTIVLNDVDRFLVKIMKSSITRINSNGSPIQQLQISGDEILNIALEVVEVSSVELPELN